jgi:hypothetical protein
MSTKDRTTSVPMALEQSTTGWTPVSSPAGRKHRWRTKGRGLIKLSYQDVKTTISPPPFFKGEAIWLASSPMLVGAWLSACHLVVERYQASCGHFLDFMSRWWFDALGS